MNKQILLSLGTLVVAGAVIVGGTGAFFSDTETSSNNVFTAGDVTLSLGNLTHTYLADEPVANLPANYVNIDGNTKSFQFGDLKPLDWGAMDGDLTNGSNDALVCARVVDTNVPSTATSPFQDLLKFRVNNGLGLTAAQTFGIAPLGEWFSLNPLAPALAMAAGQTLPAEVQYCFGDFEAGTPGDCVLNPSVDYNLAQNQSLTLDIEYYAVQARNNSDFTCASLNTPAVVTPSTGEISNAGAVYISDTGYAGVYIEFTHTGLTDATDIELQLTLDDGQELSINATPARLALVNQDASTQLLGGTVVTQGSRTSGSWTPQAGSVGNGRSVTAATVTVTLGDGTTRTQTLTNIGGPAASQLLAFPL